MAKAIKRKVTANRIVNKLKGIIDTHTNLRIDGDGRYYGKIYADYRDRLDESTIVKIFLSDDPWGTFNDSLNFTECEWEERGWLLETIKESFNDNDEMPGYDKYEGFINDWIDENVYYNCPYDHYLKQDVYIDIIVDTGDGNYDYTMNELFGCKYSEKGLSDREQSSLIWLMRQQGYEADAISDFVLCENSQGSKLFDSIYQECLNTTTCMNALTFFVKLPLDEALVLHELVSGDHNKENKYKNLEADIVQGEIILDKGTACGLYDPWNGAGSILDIVLEKNVALPVKYIDSAMPDGCRGYSVSNIYGMLGSFWSDGGLTINGMGGKAA